MALTAGTRLGPYEILSALGAGGMGVVYRARDPRLGRDVALKLISENLASDPSWLSRFAQEARAVGQLNHPNIIAVHDVGSHLGVPYIVSELLEGESLSSRLQRGALPFRNAIDYARQVAEGLAAAHAKDIIHRDLKPDNVFVTSDGRLKILDFGIAKLTRPSEDAFRDTGLLTQTELGTVMGTAAYMSPEQVRGETVDQRSDIFSVGAILHEMLTGFPLFRRETPVETMAAVLTYDPPPPLAFDVPPALASIVARCLEKTRERRFQSARDLAFDLEVLSGRDPAHAAPAHLRRGLRRGRAVLGVGVVMLSLVVAVASWLIQRRSSIPVGNPLADARFTQLTDWEGTEEAAAISPDGRYVAFLADRAGEFDVWIRPVATGDFHNLTRDMNPLSANGVFLRKFGFSGDGAEIWFNPVPEPLLQYMLMPLLGGTPRPFLKEGAGTPSWSPDGSRLAYFVNEPGDPLFVADRTGASARQILVHEAGIHNHNPVWSPDGRWIYFVHGSDPSGEMDVWRLRPSGESLERMTVGNTATNFLAPLNARTLLYVARARDRSGPWLWALDVDSKMTERVSSGPGQYTSVSVSVDGRRVVSTIANARSTLWRVPLLKGHHAEERDVHRYLPTQRAVGPRFGGASLFYLSPDGLWRVKDGQTSQIRKGDYSELAEPPAVSADGTRIAIVIRQDGKRRLAIMSSDGRDSSVLTPSLDIQGVAGQGIVDWSPDGKWIVVAGTDERGPALFKVPVNGGTPVRLAGQGTNPVWSPDGNLIVYSGPFITGQATLLGVRPDGTPVRLPSLKVSPGGYRFLPDGTALVYLPVLQSLDFWAFDFETGGTRQLTRLDNLGTLQTFDITPDGKEIVFDRSRENSDIYLIERPN